MEATLPRKVRKFVSREFAKTVDLDLLRRFLAPFAERLDFDWDALPSDDGKKRDAIFEFFRVADSRFPMELHDALHCAAVLATPSGCRVLQEQAAARGIELVPASELHGENDGRHLDPRHLALRAYLDHRALFDRAVDISAFWSVVKPFERSGAAEGVPCRHENEDACRAFATAASTYFVSRYHGRYCDVRWYPDDEEIGILVLHGKHSRVANLEEDGRERTQPLREIVEDTIRYHPESGRVKIGASSDADATKLLELFAEHLIGQADFFDVEGSDRLYVLDPIVAAGAAFQFRHDWDTDVESVLVREVQIDEGEHEVNGRTRYSPWAMTVRDSRNALERLAELAPDVTFADLRITYVKLEFRFKVNRKRTSVTVKLKPPNVASFRDHSFESSIMELLDRNGFRTSRFLEQLDSAAS